MMRGYLLQNVLCLVLTLSQLGSFNINAMVADGPPVSLDLVPIVGGVTTNSAVIGFRTTASASVSIHYGKTKNRATGNNPEGVLGPITTLEDDDFTAHLSVDNLQANTQYYYQVLVNDEPQPAFSDSNRTLSFSTFPDAGTEVRISIFADSAKYNAGRRAPVYRQGNPENDGATLALQIGDFDHSDPQTLAEHRLMHRALRDPYENSGRDFARGILGWMAFDHVYDDHDYCGNDSDKDCTFKAEVLKAYNEYYPGYDKPYPDHGIFHKFTIGDAEVFMLDTRWNRVNDLAPDGPDKTVLGSVQKDWLKQGLLDSTARWKLIVSTISANKHARPGNIDHWGNFHYEANELKEFLEDNHLTDSTIIISGDLHTGGALDGGCNSRFGLPELGIAHTNLQQGNNMATGFWTEGVRPGEFPGYGSILVGPDSITLESKDEEGVVVHTLTLPGPYNTSGCITGGGAGLDKCTDNVASFTMPTSGACASVIQHQEMQAPFPNEVADEAPIEPQVQWFMCPDTDTILLKTNDIPQHPVTINNPNKPCVQNILAEFAAWPTLRTDIDSGKTETDNIVGFAVNGVVAFSALEAGSKNAVEPAPDATLLDARHWYGHPTAQHVWHYHSPFLGHDSTAEMPTSDQFLGVAMDGFPIYGPLDNPDVVLDDCNFNNVTMRYHIRTQDQVDETQPYCKSNTEESVNWNYIVGCFRGNLQGSALHDSATTNIPGSCYSIDPAAFYANQRRRERGRKQMLRRARA